MSDLINRKELWKAFTTMFDCVCSLGEVRKTIDSMPAEEPTIDTIAERISSMTWYHINRNGELVEGASGREEALYKAEDIFRILEEMGASDI